MLKKVLLAAIIAIPLIAASKAHAQGFYTNDGRTALSVTVAPSVGGYHRHPAPAYVRPRVAQPHGPVYYRSQPRPRYAAPYGYGYGGGYANRHHSRHAHSRHTTRSVFRGTERVFRGSERVFKGTDRVFKGTDRVFAGSERVKVGTTTVWKCDIAVNRRTGEKKVIDGSC